MCLFKVNKIKIQPTYIPTVLCMLIILGQVIHLKMSNV